MTDHDLNVLPAEDPGGPVVVRDPEHRAVARLRAEDLVEAVPQPTVPMGV